MPEFVLSCWPLNHLVRGLSIGCAGCCISLRCTGAGVLSTGRTAGAGREAGFAGWRTGSLCCAGALPGMVCTGSFLGVLGTRCLGTGCCTGTVGCLCTGAGCVSTGLLWGIAGSSLVRSCLYTGRVSPGSLTGCGSFSIVLLLFTVLFGFVSDRSSCLSISGL